MAILALCRWRIKGGVGAKYTAEQKAQASCNIFSLRSYRCFLHTVFQQTQSFKKDKRFICFFNSATDSECRKVCVCCKIFRVKGDVRRWCKRAFLLSAPPRPNIETAKHMKEGWIRNANKIVFFNENKKNVSAGPNTNRKYCHWRGTLLA